MISEPKERVIADDTALGLADSAGFQTVERHEEASNRFVDDIYEEIDDTQPIYRNPYVRTGIACAGIVIVLLLGALFSGNKPTTEVVETDDAPQEESVGLTLSLEESTDEQGTSDRAEVDRLRSEIALIEQQLALSQLDRTDVANPETTAQDEPAPTEDSPSTANKPSTATPPVRPAATAQSVSARPTPRPVSVSPTRITARTPAPSRAATPQLAARQPARSVVTPPEIAPDPMDPQQQWFEISGAGVVGAMPPVDVVEVKQLTEAPAANNNENEFVLRNVNFTQRATVSEVVALADSSIPGLFSPTPSFIPFGTAAKAEVTTPVTWLSTDDQFAIEVMEDVFNSAGEVSIPKGAFIIAQADSINESSGFGRLVAVGVQMGSETIPVDNRAIAIKGKGGDPLIAEQYGNIGDDIASNDLEMFLVGAISGIGRELITPDSQTVTNGNFGSTISTDNGDPNLLGAILAGGTEQLTERMAARNDERLEALRSRETIWYLPEGHEVQIYFNEDVRL